MSIQIIERLFFAQPETVSKQDVPKREEATWQTVAQARSVPKGSSSGPQAHDKKSIDNEEKSTYSVVNSKLPALSEAEQAVLALIPTTPIAADAVIAQAQLPASTVRSALTWLALKKLIKNHPGGRVSLK